MMFVTLVAAVYSLWFNYSVILGVFFSVLIADSYLFCLRVRTELRVRTAIRKSAPTIEKQIVWFTFAVVSSVRAVLIATVIVGIWCAISVAPVFLLFLLLLRSPIFRDWFEPEVALHVWVLLVGLPVGLYFAGWNLWEKWPRPGSHFDYDDSEQ